MNSVYFTREELQCKHCGAMELSDEFIHELDVLRAAFGDMPLSSAYRCPNHPEELNKPGGPGAHTRDAVDVLVSGRRAMELVRLAIGLQWSGIGVQQKGDVATRFIHLDRDEPRPNAPRPTIWSY